MKLEENTRSNLLDFYKFFMSAYKNVGVRWNFSERQKDLIYELIDAIWKKD